jgi:hypothetical protein
MAAAASKAFTAELKVNEALKTLVHQEGFVVAYSEHMCEKFKLDLENTGSVSVSGIIVEDFTKEGMKFAKAYGFNEEHLGGLSAERAIMGLFWKVQMAKYSLQDKEKREERRKRKLEDPVEREKDATRKRESMAEKRDEIKGGAVEFVSGTR